MFWFSSKINCLTTIFKFVRKKIDKRGRIEGVSFMNDFSNDTKEMPLLYYINGLSIIN